MKSSNILEKVKALNFPADQYIVAGSAIMVMHDLRETNDIDIVASEKLFSTCSEDSSWTKVPHTYLDNPCQYSLEKDEFELYLDVNFSDEFKPSLESLLARAEYFEGVPFVCLDDLVKFKISYDRPKDHNDIKLVEDYLRNK